MKTINLTQSDKEILLAILEASPSGMTIGQVRQSIKLIDKVSEAKELLELEDADFAYLYGRFSETKFSRVSKEIVDLADKLDGVK